MTTKKKTKQHVQIRRTPEFLGRIVREIGLLNEFREKLGRDPKPDEPIAFDPEAETPTPIDPMVLTKAMIEAGREAGIDPVLLHAMEKTGWILSEGNVHLLSEEELQEWSDAIEEGRRIYGHESTRGRPAGVKWNQNGVASDCPGDWGNSQR